MAAVVTPKLNIVSPPAPSFIGGHMPSFREDPLGFLQDSVAYGSITKMRFGPVTGYVLSDPAVIQQVLVKQADKFGKSRMLRRAVADILGNGLLTSEGPHHHAQRKLIQPAFHHQRISAYADTMVKYTCSMLNEWESQPSVYLDQDMNFLTMLIVGKTLFDQDDIDEADAISMAITRRLEMFGSQLARRSLIPPLLNPITRRQRNQSKQILTTSIDAIIEERRKENTDRGDLLSMLLLSEDENGQRMSAEQVRDEAITLFVAGHETTANALTWTFYLLAQHPEIEAKLLAEIDAALEGKLPTAQDLHKLPYAEMIFKEALRLYPPAWVFGRLAREDVEIGDFTIKQGQVTIISPYALGRSERFFERPNEFDPERFHPANEEQIQKYSYIPFGAGPRVCIGNGFAMMEAILIMATILQRFHLSLAMPEDAIRTEPMITLRPAPYVRVWLHRRRRINKARATT